ncbi:AGC family protein kinase [Trichomonas vaginalis G3]|uniref:AGC family protein kinase n=1 Tax=Trichomonas vaginalis (strain ATCC PRA-98 / G3) TaxID=412133 RepID=A2DJV4_TRIV3|nr:protein serine/threonine kinase protein [Trichomonas vaginalis G3]EAY19318.1 AGC family protein kinase [Trichomonas vaginalis G3]KAI5527218.1 protein serine/threonine kinase protein [Trichomonas vaginalis G3]|eukprot:XP_001580304.1 AGC family protein kinase [Trichomonas vaginalis G3]
MTDSEPIFAIKGWISQKTNLYRSDRKLYGVVTEEDFTTYQDEQQKILYKNINLNEIKLVSQLTGARPGFSITLENSKDELIFYCPSKHQAQKWICALQLKPVDTNVDITDFDYIKEIGRGGNAIVYVARNRLKDELVAIKTIEKAHISTDKHREHIQSERNTLMRARHPFIIHLFNAFQTNTHLLFVLEFAFGGDLHFQLSKNLCSIDNFQKKLYLAEIALAVKYLHSLGIIYRDLKPENILLDSRGHIKLADFGTARQCTSQCNSFCGTAEYLAPEIISKSSSQTFAIDWWSFGIVAYCLYTGSVPFSNNNNRKMLFDAICQKPVRIPKSMDPVLADFLTRLLEKNPAKRLGSPGFDVFEHEFWDDIDWDKVYKCEYHPTFVPLVDEGDPGYNFESEDSIIEPDSLDGEETFPRFDEFSYEDLTVLV